MGDSRYCLTENVVQESQLALHSVKTKEQDQVKENLDVHLLHMLTCTIDPSKISTGSRSPATQQCVVQE
ncbi:hypothetical protein C2845_PM13G15910 [Panicum miliaceum]|uniref:Uncharacterized protein n=1 Tax=Panicum miliaceum TaxID=4540 RepID=A0A3L6RIW2_PANMI|nr:hypothetical protein C2845_PM13G15910 [Panicum miliaceum]